MTTSSGPDARRVVVVTRDQALLASLRADARLRVVAHVEDPSTALAVASGVGASNVLVDPELASGLPEPGSVDGSLRIRGGAGGGVSVAVVRPSLTWEPASGWENGPGAADPILPSQTDRLLGPRAETARLSAVPAPSGPPAGPTLRDGDQPQTLREWWLRTRSQSNPGPVVSRVSAAEVLMRQTIVVASPKGGVGKTFVSVNLASALASRSDFRVILLDLDLTSGDAAVHLDLIGQPTLAELAPYAANLEPSHLAKAVTTHRPSGLDVLLAPPRPEAGEMVARDLLGVLMRLIRQRYDFVVIDTPPDLASPLVGGCLEEATAVVLVSSLDAAALRQCRLFLDGVASTWTGRDDTSGSGPKLVLVLNQVHGSGPLPASRAASFLDAGGTFRSFLVPEDRASVERSVFAGRPLVLAEPDHEVSRAIFGLANHFCPVFGEAAGPAGSRRGGLGRLLDVIRRW